MINKKTAFAYSTYGLRMVMSDLIACSLNGIFLRYFFSLRFLV